LCAVPDLLNVMKIYLDRVQLFHMHITKDTWEFFCSLKLNSHQAHCIQNLERVQNLNCLHIPAHVPIANYYALHFFKCLESHRLVFLLFSDFQHQYLALIWILMHTVLIAEI